MKLIKKIINKKAGLFVVRLSLEPGSDDIWNLYNLIARGDLIRGTTFRKVTHESNTGVSKSVRKKIETVVSVEQIEYDGESELIRITGRNCQENKHLKLGQYQSIDLQAPRKLTLTKKQWDFMHVMKLREATDLKTQAGVAVIVMEDGMAHLFLIGRHTSQLKAKIEKSIPKNKEYNQQHQKAKRKFFEALLTSMTTHVDFNVVRVVVLASPGYTKDQFY